MVWRGGRPFKHQPKHEGQRPEPKSNGANNDVIMISDSDDEEPTGKDELHEDNPTFEEDEAEHDPSEPYDPTIQTLDLPLGVEVLHLAFPHFPPDLHRSSLPALLSQKLVCALACSDSSIRVLTVPLTPPSPQSKTRPSRGNTLANLTAGKSLFGEQMVVLSSGTTHQSIPKGVSISMTAESPKHADDIDMEDDENSSNRMALSPQTSRSRSRSRAQEQPWDLLVASHSADLSGLLLIHKIPLVEGTSLSSELHLPWRTQSLTSSAVSVEFNSALYPAPRHSRLLVAEAKGVVRILDCLPRSRAAHSSWLVSVYTDFDTTPNPVPRRKSILDARWVLGGKSLLVLLVDGNWGIWDIETGGSKPADAAKTPQALTDFVLDGWVGDSLTSKPLLKSSSIESDSRSKLAPMTPSTRKMRQDALFTGPASESDGPACGGLFVCPVHDASNTKPDDESILLWHGSNIVMIPSLFTHWQNKVRGSGNLFGSGAKGEPKTMSNIQLGGEACTEIGLFPFPKDRRSPRNSMDQAEILVTGERRLLIVTPPLAEPPTPAAAPPPPLVSSADQQLLVQGEVDIHGMDRILADMSDRHDPKSPTPKSRKFSHGSRRDLMML